MYLFSFFLLIAFVAKCDSHSFTLVPRGDFKDFNKPECRMGGPAHAPNDKCRGPCIEKSSWQYDKGHQPVYYRRGQRVRMVWARNNHHGGFVRFSLVPARDRMNRAAHDRMAFRYACFDSDKVVCPFEQCGTDFTKGEPPKMYRTYVTIPTSYPDGRYVLGWSWFGGVSSGASIFGDYWSCTDVVVKGGPLTETYQPVFHPGENIDYVKSRRKDQCDAAVNRLDVCKREPCMGHKAGYMRPRQFEGKKKPGVIRRSWMSSPVSAPPAVLTPSPAPVPTPMTTPFAKPKPTPTPSPFISLKPSILPSPPVPRPAPVPSRSPPARTPAVLRDLVLVGLNNIWPLAAGGRTIIDVRRSEQLHLMAMTRGPVREVRLFITDYTGRQLTTILPGGKLYEWNLGSSVKGATIKVKVIATDGHVDVAVFDVKLISKAATA